LKPFARHRFPLAGYLDRLATRLIIKWLSASRDVRLSGQSGSRVDRTPLLFLTDTVEKVENRKTPKISQMLIFGQVRRWDAA
jgi:hypothetical protein